MSIPGSSNPLLAYKSAAGGYSIDRSLRFNGPDSAGLSKTFSSSPTSTTAWTLSAWVKRFGLGAYGILLTAPGGEQTIRFNPSDQLEFFEFSGGGFQYNLVTTQVFRDPSAWFHLVVVWDTANGTSSNRIRIYVNGQRITTFGTATYPSSSKASVINTATSNTFGSGTLSNYYLADVYMLDGTAVSDASTFGETDATTGVWVPKTPTGLTYGTNGFHLDFADNSSLTTSSNVGIGKDTSGKGNYWVTSNLSITAGSGIDSLRDSPTNGTASTGGDAGGVTVGNYCTLNPLASTGTFANGNLEVTGATATSGLGTMAIPSSGKWYWETSLSNETADPYVGVSSGTQPSNLGSRWYAYRPTGTKRGTGIADTAYGASWVGGDIIGVAFNADNGTIAFYKNGVSQGTAFTGVTGFTLFPLNYTGGSYTYTVNFGQRAFAYAAPSGYKALCTANLPAPTIVRPDTVMDVKTYVGNGSTQSITGLGFSPDFVWIKDRTNPNNHRLFDIVRGAGKELYSALTNAEGTVTDSLTSFDSSGFSLGGNSGTNSSSASIVSWNWDAGTSNATNTSGTITSTVRANISAGFSVVTFTGTGSNGTVGHGLGVTPSVYCIKKRSGTSDWYWLTTVIDGSVDYLFLNSTAAKADAGLNYATAPTSSVFSLGIPSGGMNDSGGTYVAYCWAPVAGYSAFGSYTGNGSSDGPFVYTGFRPRFVLWKAASGLGSWYIHDTARSTYNLTEDGLFPNLSDAENNTYSDVDILSNGFKQRNAGAAHNGSGTTYIYAAFSEVAFNFARAR